MPYARGEKHSQWKGDRVSYGGLHLWVRRNLGTPSKCEHCGTTRSKPYFDWASKSRKYTRDLSDWIRLCRPCHMIYDKKNGFKKGYIPWNKGKTGVICGPKKGHIPWNKGKICPTISGNRHWTAHKKFSEQTKIKMSLSAKRRWKRSDHPLRKFLHT